MIHEYYMDHTSIIKPYIHRL